MTNTYQRQVERVAINLPILLNFGTQISLRGELKDISPLAAFVKISNRIYFQPQEELDFVIQRSQKEPEELIRGSARISRIAAGEGIAIYFTKMDENSSNKLRELVSK